MSQKIDVGTLGHFPWWRLEVVRGPNGVRYECRIKPGKGLGVVVVVRATPGDAVRFALHRAFTARANKALTSEPIPPACVRS